MRATTQAKNRRKRVLIVDDHPLLRKGIAQLLDSEPDLEVCAEAETATEALRLVEKHTPDLVLADLSLPGKDGLELIRDLLASTPSLPILVLSMHDETLYAERALRAGARGYLMKDQGGTLLIEAIRRVLSGQIHVSPKMSAAFLEKISGRSSASPAGVLNQLTDREFSVFRLVGQGKTTRQIAHELHISVKTVEVHRIHIKSKLQITHATELVRYAVRWVESQGL